MGYELWLKQVLKIADFYNIEPKDLLKMLYVTDSEYDYRKLYENYDRYAYYVKFLSGGDNAK